MKRQFWGKTVCLLLLLGAGPLGLRAQEIPTEPPPIPVGHWVGSITMPGGEALEINVDLLFQDDVWSGDISIPEHESEDFPLSVIRVIGPAVSFRMGDAPLDPNFRGTLSEDGGSMAGVFLQGPTEFPFRLTKRS